MSAAHLTSRRLLAFQAGLGAALAVASAPSAAQEKVIVTGTSVDLEQQSASPFTGGVDAEVTLQAICNAADRLAMYSGPAQVELATQMARAGLDSSMIDLASENLGEAIDEVCDREDQGEPFTISPFTMVYASCMMRMESPDGTMAIRIDPDGSDAVMEVTDHASQEGTQFVLLANFTGQIAAVAGTGTSSPINMTPTGASREIAGYTAEQHTFDYSMSLGGDGLLEEGLDPAAAAGLGQTLAAMTRLTSNGEVWASRTAPGSDIIRAFYDNLAVVMENAQGIGSFMSGTLRNLYGMVREGMPLEVSQTINAAMGMSSYSWTRVESITVRPLEPGECGWTTIPEGYAVSDMNEQMSNIPGQGGGGPGDQTGGMPGGLFGGGAMGGATAGMSAEQQAEAAAAMAQAAASMQQAMAGMTPEEQAAMQQVGGMLGGLFGGAAAGGANVPGTAAAGASPGAAAPAAARPSGPSLSSALMTDDLTQSAQNLLSALGYDPGNTDGELSIETTIAISQFQAEQGMEVTGEVTPQLLGILAAQVDAL